MASQSAKLITVILLSWCLSSCGGSDTSSTDTNSNPAPTAPAEDTTPDQFSFEKVTDVEPATTVDSNTITVSGINSDITASVSGATMSVNGAAFIAQDTQVSHGDTIQLRLVSADDYQTQVTARLTLATVSADFAVTTKALTQTPAPAANQVSIHLDLSHITHGVDTFDRSKFITIHASHTENDWYQEGQNQQPDLVTQFANDYDVYFGRDTGAMRWQLSQLDESMTAPGFADPDQATQRGGDIRWLYTNNSDDRAVTQRALEHRAKNMIVAGQLHPFWPDGTDTGKGWAFSQQDTSATPFGTATGDFMGQYLAKYFNKMDGIDAFGQPKPKFLEVLNEPLYELVDTAPVAEDLDKIFTFHNAVAQAARNVTHETVKPNQQLLVGGYTAAFPDFEVNQFQQWRQRHQRFIDLAGEQMDFLSIHLYDFPKLNGLVKYRKGSNMEATLDLLETYTQHKFGQPKPMVISEYGAQVHEYYNQPWSPKRDWLILKSVNSMLMSFLSRPHLIEMTVPFIVVKAEWGRESADVPYYWRLMRQQHEMAGETGNLWVYTDLVKFYQLWANVAGQRLFTQSENPDIQVDAYHNQHKTQIIFNNLDFDRHTLPITLNNPTKHAISQVTIKQLYLDEENGDKVVLKESTMTEMPESIDLEPEATAIIEVAYDNEFNPKQQLSETKHYVDSMLLTINKNEEISFSINDINHTSEAGEAILRLSLGRAHGLSLTPTLLVNGHTVDVPQNYRGYDQEHDGFGRSEFYGTIEVPIEWSLLQQNNTFSLTFADSGGYVATIALQHRASTMPL
ncbi:agarase [Paraferrimonas haliotis]|uniref:Agarase n=1 Tax=Paraferrimonas haliotis TaxID=2013866 RepID=A0AA37TZS6_9GAMM|nr:agarase [Paraferrimonas haliotis]GLS83854.1 hypothetical protein GCM10007894_18310 [Paraferrimonas haliotis]GLS83981.1 hypothetical protein GCM10007894_19580 [Paraferrimonas haliotis]